MRKARRTDAAERDLQEIAFHIAFQEGRAVTAGRVIDELIAQAEKLAQLSATAVLGTAAPEISDGVRLFSYS